MQKITINKNSLHKKINSPSLNKIIKLEVNLGGSVKDNNADNISLDYSNERTNTKIKTLATLGSGNIQVRNKEDSDTKMLNRDIENNNVNIYNISSHKGLKGELDTRLVIEKGRDKIAEDYKKTAEAIQDMPVVGQTLSYQTKDGQTILLENNKFYKYNSEGKKEELVKGNYIVYKSGMLNTPQDTKQGYQELTDGTMLQGYENVILVNNPTHLFGVADAIESAVGYIGIPTGNSFQTQEFNKAANKLGTILNLTHSQANIVEKNANRLHYGEPLLNIYTISIGSPEYAGKDQGNGNTLDNASNGAGANFIIGFNNKNDAVSLSGVNKRENAPDRLIDSERGTGHRVKDYQPHLFKKDIKEKIEKLLNKNEGIK